MLPRWLLIFGVIRPLKPDIGSPSPMSPARDGPFGQLVDRDLGAGARIRLQEPERDAGIVRVGRRRGPWPERVEGRDGASRARQKVVARLTRARGSLCQLPLCRQARDQKVAGALTRVSRDRRRIDESATALQLIPA